VGKYLLAVAECVALQCGFKEMAIISGVGVSTRHSQKQIENCLYWSNRIVLHI
jgi:histone acetyltransferase (RNA polymerase elongator complex component)